MVDVESKGEGGLGSERRAVDETSRDGHLGSQSSTQDTLLLPGEGRGALVLLRGDQGDLDSGDGGGQCRVSGWHQGSPCGVGDEPASGGEARGRLPGEASRRDGVRGHDGGEGAHARWVSQEAEPRGENAGNARWLPRLRS